MQSKKYIIAEEAFTKLPPYLYLEILFENINVIILILIWSIFANQFAVLPAQIAIEYDFSGTPTKFTQKSSLVALPIFALLLYIIFSNLQMVPSKLKYMINLHRANVQDVYLLTRLFLMYLKATTNLLFLTITVLMLKVLQLQLSSEYLYISLLYILPYVIGTWIYWKKMKLLSCVSLD